MSTDDQVAIVNLVPITLVDQKLLVAVPQGAWHRQTARRVLPRNALMKPTNLSVAGVSMLGGEEDLEVKLWVGFLDSEVVELMQPGPSSDPDALTFLDASGAECLPSAFSLKEFAGDHYGFLSAVSHADDDAVEAEAGGAAVSERLSILEASIASIRDSLAALPLQMKQQQAKVAIDPAPHEVPAGSRKSALRKSPGDRFANLDPAVAASARSAGIPEEHLAKLSQLFEKKPAQMADLPRTPRQPARNVLSESEDEDEDLHADTPEGGAGDAPGSPIEKAAVQLTKLVANISKKDRSASGIDGILDRSEGGLHEVSSSSSSGSRSKAAAYQKLRAALVEKPEWLYTSIEEKLVEDFTTVRSAPSSGATVASSRGWVEHRSKLGHYPATIRFAWVVAGIHDSLRSGDVAQARARCALALAAIDQSSLDSGNWALAQEMLLELPPPYAAFVNRRMPEPSEQISTRLADDRLTEILLWRLKDRDSFLESKKRLGQASRPKAPSPPGNPSAKPSPKIKAKAKAKSGSAEEHGGGEG